jgi:amino acid transporter
MSEEERAVTSVPQPWEFAGWGTAERLDDLDYADVTVSRLDQPVKHTLGVWSSTAICGNDITSSCLYVSALCAVQAGAYAPIALALVAAALYLFRRVYGEVGSALPLNGGTYTVLLNTTNKKLAAGAACLTLLSYVATAVISAGEAMHYAHNLWEGLHVFYATVALLAFFAALNLIGISESAAVALAIFAFHITTLTILSATAAFAVVSDPSLLAANWQRPNPNGLPHALFFGFAAAMLGISGFESSANFIEEQEEGVFPHTLRNMWIAVAIFNPLISLLSLGLLPLAEIQQVPPDLLADMGQRSVGGWLRTWVSIDAVLVLSGAVLTSYVGVIGLMRRMSLDRCLPQWLLAENRWRATNHWIIVIFFAVCCSILVATGGVVELLAGVYALSFLSVMALFAVGNMMLKVRRARLPREIRASWGAVALALAAVLVALAGNILIDPSYLRVFAGYFLATGAVVALMFLRVQLMRGVLFISRAVVDRVQRVNEWIRVTVHRKIEEINSLGVVYFTKGDSPAELNRAALYVMENEQTTRLRVVHAYEREEDIPAQLAEHLKTIDRMYPPLRIDFIAVKGKFGPELIELLSRRLAVPKNYMFIGTPGDRFPHRIEDLGGVRVIL